MKLPDNERTEHWEWCRTFIDQNCIYRSDPTDVLLTTKFGGLAQWQFYMQVGMLDQEFQRRIGLLFWDFYKKRFDEQPFQICGCETGGVAMATTIQRTAYEAGFTVNAFSIKKIAKQYGIKNWFEGIVLDKLPVMLVDDVVASGKTIAEHAKRVSELGLPVYREAFCPTACKKFAEVLCKVDDKDIVLRTFFYPVNFAFTPRTYIDKYGSPPVFRGSIV